MAQDGRPVLMETLGAASPWFWIGLSLAVLVGMSYGYLHHHVTCMVYLDPMQPSPGMAAVAPYYVGFLLIPIVMPLVLAVVHRLTLRRSGGHGWPGYVTLLVVGLVGVWAGQRAHEWLWAGTGEAFCG